MQRVVAWVMAIVGGLSFMTLAVVDIATGSTGRGSYEVAFGRPGESCGDAALYVDNANGNLLACQGNFQGSPLTSEERGQLADLALALGRGGLADGERDRITALAASFAEAHGDDFRPRGYISDSPLYSIAIGVGVLMCLIGIARLQAIRRRPAE